MICEAIEVLHVSRSSVVCRAPSKPSVAITWDVLRAAARQSEKDLREVYAAALALAERKMLTKLRDDANRRVAACIGHRAAQSKDRGYQGPVSREANPAAHGNICVHETCACGAERQRNVNGRHEEIGAWKHPAIDIQDARAAVE